MKRSVSFILALGFYSLSLAQTSVEQVTSVSNVGLSVNSYGTIGNAFRGGFDIGNPSCEFPKNSGIEHLFEGGIWIGGLINGSLTAVSTSAVDNSRGYSTGTGGYEMSTEIGASIKERSSFFNSPNYNPEAISHQDFVMDFSDKNRVVPGTNIQIQSHDNPLNLQVHLESYNWNFAFSDFFVILNYSITNDGPDYIEDAYIALWNNTVVRNTNITPAGQGGSAFYNKGGNGFIDSLNLAYCYDHSGDVGFTESYIGQKFLGAEKEGVFFHPRVDSNFLAHYNAWIFNNSSDPIFFIPTNDNQRYQKMTNGMNQLSSWSPKANPDGSSLTERLNNAGNRADLISFGPFPRIESGETVNIAFAIVLGKKFDDGKPNSANTPAQQSTFVQNADWAQTAYNGEDVNFNGILDEGEDKDGDGKITRFILPSPPDVPQTRVEANDSTIEVYWTSNAEESLDPISLEKDFEGYRVYLTKLGFDVTGNNDLRESMNLAAEYDIRGNQLFFETGFDDIQLEEPASFEGDSLQYNYKYTFSNVIPGWQYVSAVTAFDRGDEQNNLESLETSPLVSLFRVFPGQTEQSYLSQKIGTRVNNFFNKERRDSIQDLNPYAYPNPYYLQAAWEGSSTRQETKKIVFANLPKRCIVRIFNSAGDLIDEFNHNELYSGNDILWFETYSDTERTAFSGGEHAWDLLSADQQLISRGIYLFSVEDLDSGVTKKGKFAIIK